MATYDRPKPTEGTPVDLLPVIRNSGVLNERQLADIKAKMLSGEYPFDPHELAGRLVKEGLLTSYQVSRFLKNKSHGLLVGRYAILDRLGSGSMGRVYKAHHLLMDRVVALKIIAPEIVSNERVVARFQREMKLVGRLDHPNVVRAFDADQMGNVLYIVMEYVAGQSLGQRLKQGPLPVAEMIEYAAQASLGLAHAHEQGIVHRDIKPSNLLLSSGRQLKVLDLGLGVLMEADSEATFATADGIAVGTIDYMSPEQACGKEVDGRSDLYSLGCAMFHLMTGRLPFPGDTPIDRLGKRISGRPMALSDVLPNVPAGLLKVMDRLIAQKPADRFQSAAEAADALQALIRPKSKTIPVTDKPVAEPAPAPAVSAVAAVKVVRPTYPGWFRPAATLAEARPALALALVIAVLGTVFAAGFVLARLLR
ncbi:MAG: serine/threonine-protein kinase [Isosphaeraceae bacterium]|nr:serine/threonine-protein kinase [Isosphaeraceae bacterium]